jgi:adenosylmethionine-8-amino-7-oxononanoate aminotransferase
VVRDQATKAPLSGEQAEWLLKDVLSAELWKRGLICRLDDRADPIVQIAPPLVADAALFEEIASIMRASLEVAAERLGELAPAPASGAELEGSGSQRIEAG